MTILFCKEIIMNREEQPGRATETIQELDSTIASLKQAMRKLEDAGSTVPVELPEALDHARHVRDLIDKARFGSSTVKKVAQCMSYLVRLAKDIHEMLPCFSPRLVCI